MSGTFQQRSSNVVEASYEIAMLIAKNKKSHNIGESLVKPSILVAAELVLGKDKAICFLKLHYPIIQLKEESMNYLKISNINFSTK